MLLFLSIQPAATKSTVYLYYTFGFLKFGLVKLESIPIFRLFVM